MRTRFVILASLVAALILVGSPAFGTTKPRIDALDELPPHSYPVSGTVMDLVQSTTHMAEFRSALRRDISTDLATYDITDSATLQKLYGCLLRLDLLEQSHVAGLVHLDTIHALEEKEASRLMNWLVPQAILRTRTSLPPGASDATLRAAFKDSL